MKLVVLYEHKSHRTELESVLIEAGHTVTLCKNSSDFLEAASSLSADRLIVDVKSWFRGSSIYNYFSVGEKLAATPMLFFNAPEGFTSVENRPAHFNDIILPKERASSAIIAALA